jgi:hypothetical protein
MIYNQILLLQNKIKEKYFKICQKIKDFLKNQSFIKEICHYNQNLLFFVLFKKKKPRKFLFYKFVLGNDSVFFFVNFAKQMEKK